MVLRTLPSLYRFGAKMCSAAKEMGPHYYTGSGEVLSKSAFLDSLSVDVRDKCNRAAGPTAVLMGENHSDPAAHTIEMDILKVGNCSVSSFTPVRGRSKVVKLFQKVSPPWNEQSGALA